MANINDHAARFRKGLSNPFSSEGREWCPTCRMHVDHDTQGRHQGTTYAYRRRCKRCGYVLARGVSDVQLVNIEALPPAALRWSVERGEDRR